MGVSNKFIEKFLLVYIIFMVFLCVFYYVDSNLLDIVNFEKLIYIITETCIVDVILTVENIINEPMFNLVMQTFFIVIISSWSRAAGPRSRVDFLSDITWKKILFLIVLGLLLIVVVHLFI